MSINEVVVQHDELDNHDLHSLQDRRIAIYIYYLLETSDSMQWLSRPAHKQSVVVSVVERVRRTARLITFPHQSILFDQKQRTASEASSHGVECPGATERLSLYSRA